MESLEKWQKWKIWKRSQDWWNFQAGKWSWKGVFWPQESSNMVQECDARGRWHQPYLPILTSQVNLDSSKIVAYREANTNGNLATESMNLRKKIPTQNYGKNEIFFWKIEGWMSIEIWKNLETILLSSMSQYRNQRRNCTTWNCPWINQLSIIIRKLWKLIASKKKKAS